MTVVRGVDALLPAEIAEKAEGIGAEKARLDVLSLFVLAILAGAFIALGGMFATTAIAGADDIPWGLSRLLAGLVFSLGLILVIVGGAELFTGNTLMVMAWAAGKIRLIEMLRAWLIVYVGNFIGAGATALLVLLSGQYLGGGGKVGAEALQLADAKATLPMDRALFLGILCNVLVCLAVWLCFGARTTGDKILAIVFPISAFVAAGFEHSVANMYFIPLGIMIKAWAPDAFWTQIGTSQLDLASVNLIGLIRNLVPVTIGNIVGGGFLVGSVYWFVYLRKRGG